MLPKGRQVIVFHYRTSFLFFFLRATFTTIIAFVAPDFFRLMLSVSECLRLVYTSVILSCKCCFSHQNRRKERMVMSAVRRIALKKRRKNLGKNENIKWFLSLLTRTKSNYNYIYSEEEFTFDPIFKNGSLEPLTRILLISNTSSLLRP